MPSFDALRHFELSTRDTLLRRFIPWPRFESLVDQGLYFAPASKFEDKREGHHTNRDGRERDTLLRQHGASDSLVAMAAEANATVQRLNQGPTVISCWTVELPDCSRMWKEYGRSDEAVMIETTVGRLIDCLGDDFLIVQVRYVDLESDRIPRVHSLLPFFHKAKSYDWEKEVRIIGDMVMGEKIGTPRIVPVNLKDLLTRVVVSPTAPDAFAEAVESLVEKVIPGLKVERLKR